MASLGSLVIQMAVDTAKFQGDLGRAAAIAESRMRNIRDTAKKTIGQLSAIGLAVGGAMAVALKAGIDRADEMRDMAQSVGLSVENLTRLQFAASQSGVSLEQLGTGLVRLSKHLQEVGDNRSVDVALASIAEQFAKMPDGANKTALALQYFGRSGAELIPLLNEGAAGIAEMMKQADELGYTISENTAAAADQFNDQLGRLTGTLTAFKVNLAAQMLPTLNALAAQFLNTQSRTEAMDKAVRSAAAGLKILLTGGEIVRLVFQQIGESFGALAASMVQAAQGNWRQAWEIMKARAEDGRAQLQTSVTRLLDIWDTASATAAANAPTYGKNLAAPALVAVDLTKKAAADMARVQAEIEAANRGTMTNLEQQVARWNKFEADLALLQKSGTITGDVAAARRDEFISEVLSPIEVTAQKIVTTTQATFSGLSAFADEAARNMQSAFADFLFDPFEKGLKGLLASFIDTIRRMVAEAAAAQILQAFFGFIGGAFGGGASSAVSGGSIASWGGARAAGGPVMSGSAYMVGERGPELFVPRSSGTIVPNGGGSVSLSYTIDARGADADRIMAILPPLLQRTKNETISAMLDLQRRGRFA